MEIIGTITKTALYYHLWSSIYLVNKQNDFTMVEKPEQNWETKEKIYISTQHIDKRIELFKFLTKMFKNQTKY